MCDQSPKQITDLMNIHCPSYGTGILRFKYDEELNKLKQKGDQEYKFAKRITDFYDSLYNDPILQIGLIESKCLLRKFFMRL